jgi:peptidoglycan/xylan/chitin deacetylase (PgdA/CDA1 family)
MPSTGKEVFVLCYHSINNDNWLFGVSPETFKKQMNYLSKKYTFITLKDIEDHLHKGTPLPKPSVAITFDDAYEDVLQVKDFIKERGIRPTLFVIASKKPNRIELDTKRSIMTKKQILSLVKDGWQIGCHTLTHPDMNTLSETEIEKEVVLSKKQLEKALGLRISYIAYPKGRYNRRILKAAERAKYKLGMTVKDGDISLKTHYLEIPRIGVDRTHTFIEFKYLANTLVAYFRSFMRGLGYGI